MVMHKPRRPRQRNRPGSRTGVPLAVSLTPPPLPPAEPGELVVVSGLGSLLLLSLEALVSEVPPKGAVRFP